MESKGVDLQARFHGYARREIETFGDFISAIGVLEHKNTNLTFYKFFFVLYSNICFRSFIGILNPSRNKLVQTTSLMSIWFLYCKLSAHFGHFACISIVDFEEGDTRLGILATEKPIRLCSVVFPKTDNT